MRKLVFILTAALLVLILPAALAETEEKALTVMVYLTGSNLESSSGLATEDVREMLRSGYDREQVNVVLLTGGSTKWVSGFPVDATGLYVLDRVSRPTEVERFPLMNMGDADTLSFFMRTCQERFPAEAYILILWDHGGGPLLGVCSDRLHDKDALSLAELGQALADSGFSKDRKLRLIGFDACLMGALEVATVCAPYADYMVASQELEPGIGWNYRFLRDLGADADGAEIGRQIIRHYFEGAEREIRKGTPVTLSCIDLSRIDALNRALSPLFRGLADSLDDRSYARYSVSRQASASVARSSGREYDLVDLRSLLTHYGELSGTDPAEAIDALDAAVVSQQSTVDGLTGLTVYFPFYNKEEYAADWGSRYAGISAFPDYADWIRGFGGILTGEALTDWRIAEVEQEEDQPGVFTLYLTPDQQESFVSAELLVLTHYPGYGYVLANRFGDIDMDRHGMLTATIDNQCLYPIGRDGEILNYEVPFREVDGFYLLRAQVHRNYLLYDDDWIRWADFRLRENPETGLLEIVDAFFVEDDDFPGRNEVDFSVWESIYFVVHFTEPLRDEQGLLLPFDQWDDSGERWLMYGFSVDQLAGFGFRPAASSAAQRCACFQILDVQGNLAVSELIPVVNPNVTAIPLEETLVDSEVLGVVLGQVQVNRTEVDSGITLSMTMENRLDRKMTVYVQNIRTDQIFLTQYASDSLGSYVVLNPGEVKPVDWTLPIGHLRYTGCQSISGLSLEFEVTMADPGDDPPPVDAGHSTGSGKWLYDTGFDTQLDLSGLIEPLPEEPLTTAKNGGLHLDVYSCRVEEDGSLVLHVGLRNRTGQLVDSSLFGSINGHCFGTRAAFSGAADAHPSFTLRHGQDWYGLIRFSAGPSISMKMMESDNLYRDTVLILVDLDTMPLQSEELFLDYGIRLVGEITLHLTCTSADDAQNSHALTLTVRLKEPLDYAAARGIEIPPSPEDRMVISTADSRIWLDAIRITEEKVIAVYDWQNLSDDFLMFTFFNVGIGPEISGVDFASIDLRQYDVMYVYPGETARITCVYTPEASPLPLTELRLSVPMPVRDPDYLMRYNRQPAFTVRFNAPVTAPCILTDGFTVIPETDSP